MSSNQASVIGVVGSTGMGKGVYIKKSLLPSRANRLRLVWSPLEDSDCYSREIGGVVVRSFAMLYRALDGGERAIVYWPTNLKREFPLFCALAFSLRDAVVVIEEVSDVTTASHAPPDWRRLSKQGRHRGLELIAAMQRPAQCDKEFFGACTEIRCFRVGQVYEEDAALMGSVMRQPRQKIADLPKLSFVHRVIETGQIIEGSMTDLLGKSSIKPGKATRRRG